MTAQAARRENVVERAIGRYDASLRGFLRARMGAEDEVQDALQETYERLLHYRHSDWDDLPRALVMRIAHSVVVDRARHRASRQAHLHLPLDKLVLASVEATPERHALAQQDLALVRAAIREMPARCQAVFVLSRIKGMDYQQIASHLAISVKAVEKHMSRALTLCRQRVEAGHR